MLPLVLKNVLYTAVVPAMVAVYLPLYLMHERAVEPAGPFSIAIVFLAIGGALIIRSVRDFAALGQGTPVPIDPPKKLVVRGIYRYTRNPIYLGILAVILGWAILYQSVTLLRYALGTLIFFQGFIMLYEERQLRKKFGDDYTQYCARVNRWLPRFPGRQSAQ